MFIQIHCLQLHGNVDIVAPSPQTTVLIRKQGYWIKTCGAVSMCILIILHIFELAEAAAGVSWKGSTVPANYGVPSCIWQRLMRLEMKRCVQNATAAKCQSNYCQLDKRWKCARICAVTANSVSLIVFSGIKLVSNYVIPLFPHTDLKITRKFSYLCSASVSGWNRLFSLRLF